MIKVGDALPAVTLMEYVEVEGNGCSLGPNPVKLPEALAGKTIAVFAVPGAFTPTCSEKHLPGYVAQAEELKAAGVDEIWCLAVNDAFVMGAWGRDQKVAGKVRMIADGDIAYAIRLVRCLNKMEALILPKLLAELAVKEYPADLSLKEKLTGATQIYLKVAQSYFKRSA